jgi:hypothetical protein
VREPLFRKTGHSMASIAGLAVAILVLASGPGEAAPLIVSSVGTSVDALERVNCTSGLNPSACVTGNDTEVVPTPHWAWGGPDYGAFEAAFGGAASAWISFRHDTGGSSFVVDNQVVLTFTKTVVLGGDHAGFLNVAADDSTSVWLNGVLLFAEAPSAGNAYVLCSDVPIGCRSDTFAQLAITLGAGTHTLAFQTAQRRLSAYGLRFYGELTPTQIAEPGVLALLGLGAAMAGRLWRRRR